MTTMTYREALRSALREVLASDPRVFLMGEDVGLYGGAFAVSHGLIQEFGPERVRDTPLSESTFVGAGIGAALNGMRPIVEVMTVNFSMLAMDQVLNNAATLRYMSGGQFHGCGRTRHAARRASTTRPGVYLRARDALPDGGGRRPGRRAVRHRPRGGAPLRG
jgi:pyruvate/2-oxoglutarate/acetoin dehydrogenase E1 component